MERIYKLLVVFLISTNTRVKSEGFDGCSNENVNLRSGKCIRVVRIVIKATGPHISWMNWTCHSQLIWRLATQIYRNCHRTWLRHHNWWNGDESNFPTLSKNIEQRREVHRIGQQTSISAFLHLRNLMYGGVNQRFPSNGNLNERESQ